MATVADHIVPHKGDLKLFWDERNWQGLCAPCHDIHKQSEERLGFSKEVDEKGNHIDPQHFSNKKWIPKFGKG